jgi:hypothetical protein
MPGLASAAAFITAPAATGSSAATTRPLSQMEERKRRCGTARATPAMGPRTARR